MIIRPVLGGFSSGSRNRVSLLFPYNVHSPSLNSSSPQKAIFPSIIKPVILLSKKNAQACNKVDHGAKVLAYPDAGFLTGK